MIQAFIMRIIQSVEMIQSKGWTALVKELFYIKREAILLEKDLSEVNEDRSYLEKENLKFVELTSQTIKQYEYTLKSRYHKAVLYCKKGYQGFAIIRENRIIGDTWYYTSRLSNKPIDIGWLGWNDWSRDDIYTFDILLVPEERGKYLSSVLQNLAMHSLKKQSYKKAYTYIWSDNIPSIWMTRVTNKWKEIGRIRVSRLVIFRIRAKSD